MTLNEWIAVAGVIAALLLAGATVWLGWLTRKLELAWLKTSEQQIGAWFKTSKEQIGVQTWLELQQRFDSLEMRRARKKLADQLKHYSASNHQKIAETVMNFFEDVGTLYRLDYV